MSLQERIARALGWAVHDVQSLSLASLRDLVRPVDAALAAEIGIVLASGSHVRGPK